MAPFRSKNMSKNWWVCAAGWGVGRAQWVQAVACGVEPEAGMNPVLLKPGSDRRSHVVLMGRAWGNLEAGECLGDVLGRDAEIEAAGEEHVARDAAHRLEVEDLAAHLRPWVRETSAA